MRGVRLATAEFVLGSALRTRSALNPILEIHSSGSAVVPTVHRGPAQMHSHGPVLHARLKVRASAPPWSQPDRNDHRCDPGDRAAQSDALTPDIPSGRGYRPASRQAGVVTEPASLGR